MQSTQGMVVEKKGKCNYFHREGHFKYQCWKRNTPSHVVASDKKIKKMIWLNHDKSVQLRDDRSHKIQRVCVKELPFENGRKIKLKGIFHVPNLNQGLLPQSLQTWETCSG